MNKVLLDTNILIYSIDEDSQYFHKAQKIILNSNLELFTTSKNLPEFLAVITRIPNSSLSIVEALTIIQDLLFKYKPFLINCISGITNRSRGWQKNRRRLTQALSQ